MTIVRTQNTNLANILVHPFNGLDRILDAIVETGGLLYLLRCQKPIHANSITERDHDDVIAARPDQARAIHWFTEKIVSTSREEDENRQRLILRRDGWCLNINKETVLRVIVQHTRQGGANTCFPILEQWSEFSPGMI